MVLQVASIIFNDSASQFNKDLTDFLKRNTETAIRKGQLTFTYRIAQSADLAELRSQGIKRLPAMTINNRPPIIGVPDIIEEIRKRVRNSRGEAAVKTEDEIVRDYQMNALGDIKKDADGKFVINDDDTSDEKAQLLANFQKEVERRGQTQTNNLYGENTNNDKGTADKRMTKNPPPKPTARGNQVERDDDFENRAPPIVQQQGRRTAPPRPDNLANPAMGDAFASLQRIRRTASGGDDRQDDNMMAQLLERMGGE